ncbi:MAG: DUF1926 domain-containing protein [Treponema sp.]|nr:DUF1926 domain-containing protein [Treponema sp.]MCL2232265.1 DUF1926 domain-containing protein [Treponema sp.]
MSKSLSLILGASGHLPSGAGEAEFEALYDKEIKPLVQALNKFPAINMVFHYSGVILYWIERRHPELFMLLEDLLSRKQAEFIGGGFYNPMLPLLPQADKIGQIEMLTTYLRKHFGKRPQGCWFPPLAWEQNLVGPLSSCGMNYTFLEDRQFSGAGAEPNEAGLFFPCITEDQGKLITVFPIARSLGSQLRAAACAQTSGETGGVAKILGALLEKLPEGDFPLMVFPFGSEASSPQETAISYESFLQDFSDADPRIEFTTAFKVSKSIRHLKRVYFPGAWAYPNAGQETHPRQFLADYPEAGGIYAKMIYVHTLINNQLRGDKTRKRTALEELWKSQDSSVFSLGTAASPGLFHAPVRKAAYRSLLEAEKITREKGKFAPSLSVFDFDLDGEGEYIFQDDKLNCCVKSRGAGIFELDYLPAAWNYLDTLSLQRGERRRAFVDWLAPAGTLADDAGPRGIPSGVFCGSQEYDVSETDRVRRRLGFRLPPRAGALLGEIEIEKTWYMKKNSIALEYVLKNSETRHVSFVFCPQMDFSFAGEGEAFLRVLAQREGGKEGAAFDDAVTIKSTKALEFQDLKNETLITLEASRSFDARIFHVRAGSFREEYQSTCIMPFFSVSLEGEKSWKMTVSLRISS